MAFLKLVADVVSRFDLTIRSRSQLAFIFTSTCESVASGLCSSAGGRDLARGVNLVNEPQGLASLGDRLRGSLGRHLMRGAYNDLKDMGFSYDLADLAVSAMLPLAVVNVHCGPCVCAISTASRLCKECDSKEIPYKVRVDHRLPVRCCGDRETLGRLRDVLDAIEEWETTGEGTHSTAPERYLDRVWLEQRIYQLELQAYDGDGRGSQNASLAELLEENSRDPEGISVYIAELDKCMWALRTSPFPWTPRMPRQNEIFKFVATPGLRLAPIYLGTFTSNKAAVSTASEYPSEASSIQTIPSHSGTESWASTTTGEQRPQQSPTTSTVHQAHGGLGQSS